MSNYSEIMCNFQIMSSNLTQLYILLFAPYQLNQESHFKLDTLLYILIHLIKQDLLQFQHLLSIFYIILNVDCHFQLLTPIINLNKKFDYIMYEYALIKLHLY